MPPALEGLNQLAYDGRLQRAVLSVELARGEVLTRRVELEIARIQVSEIWADSTTDAAYYTKLIKERWYKYDDPDQGYATLFYRMPETDSPPLNFNYRSIEPGSEVYIHGSGFLDEPGTVEILVNGQRIPIEPLGGDSWWADTYIRFKVGRLPGLYKADLGILKIHTAGGNKVINPDFGFVYGPEMSIKVVSGEKLFVPTWEEDTSFAREDNGGRALFVSHDPGCGFFKTSERGYDCFFCDKKLPQGVKLEHFLFLPIKHDDADNQLLFLKNYLLDIVTSAEAFTIVGIGMALIRQNFELLVGDMFDSIFGDGGGYYADIRHLPRANEDSPSISVNWENACTGPNASLPIMYLMTFTVTGPKEVIDRL
jgi:hypothetical protein